MPPERNGTHKSVHINSAVLSIKNKPGHHTRSLASHLLSSILSYISMWTRMQLTVMRFTPYLINPDRLRSEFNLHHDPHRHFIGKWTADLNCEADGTQLLQLFLKAYADSYRDHHVVSRRVNISAVCTYNRGSSGCSILVRCQYIEIPNLRVQRIFI